MKKTVILILLLVCTACILSNTSVKPKKIWQWDPVAGFGVGRLYQISVHNHYKHNYISFKYISEDLFTDSPPFNREFIVLYGRTYNLNTKLKGYISASLGIGINQKYFYLNPDHGTQELQKEYSAGIPFDISIIKVITPLIGYGVNATFNLHGIKTLGSAFFSIYVGNFKNNDYKPEGKKLIPKIEYKIPVPAIIDSSYIVRENDISLEFNWLYFLTFAGFKNNICFSMGDMNFIIAFQSREEQSNEIYDQYSTMRSLGFKVRSFFHKSGWFYDYGLHYLTLHQEKFNPSEEDHWLRSTNAFLSFGHRFYFKPNLYLKTQMNAYIPFMGDDIPLNGYGVLSDAMLMDFDILSIGYSFSDILNR